MTPDILKKPKNQEMIKTPEWPKQMQKYTCCGPRTWLMNQASQVIITNFIVLVSETLDIIKGNKLQEGTGFRKTDIWGKQKVIMWAYLKTKDEKRKLFFKKRMSTQESKVVLTIKLQRSS